MIDIYYRIKALHELGVKIHLHCFEYGRGQSNGLTEFCEAVHYYPRKRRLLDAIKRLPFIVASRRDKTLLENLEDIEAPILFEGLHTTAFLSELRLKHRIKMVRAHNIEHEYYSLLAHNAKGWKRRFFFKESHKLANYEPVLKHANHIFAIKEPDAKHFEKYGRTVSVLPPCFELNSSSEINGTKPLVLFHGNLAIIENSHAMVWICENILPIEGVEFVFAGKSPSPQLKTLAESKGAKLIDTPDSEEMNRLIKEARVHLLPTKMRTGVKLKLLNALQGSGYIIASNEMVEGTGLEEFVTIAGESSEWTKEIKEMIVDELDSELLRKRHQHLLLHYSPIETCKEILTLIS